MNIRIKYTKKNYTNIREKNAKKNLQKSVILGQFLGFVTLILTFKMFFLDILSLFPNNVVLCNIFLKKKKLLITLIRKLLIKYC